MKKVIQSKVLNVSLAIIMVMAMIFAPFTSVYAGEGEGEYLGLKTEAKVYDDFQNDIWLQYQQKTLNVGDTVNLRPWRVAQIISDAIANDVQRPNFHFEIISGDSVSLDTAESNEKAVVTAEKPGTSVVKVTYDALEYKGKTWDAISPVNTGYAVYVVGETGNATLNVSDNLKDWRHYDTIYYNKGETVPFAFNASAENAESFKVTVNGIEIQGDGDRYIANLENRANIIGIVATDMDGNTNSMYRVVDARFIQVNVENKTSPKQPLKAGDTAQISFRGITMPVYKLATIYNPQFYSSTWGGEVARVTYQNEKLGSFEGKCTQWDLATRNSFEVTFNEAGDYTFTSPNGIFLGWWGSPLGSDLTAAGPREPNLNAPSLKGNFSKLPDFTVHVEAGESTNIPWQDINATPKIDARDKTITAGDSFDPLEGVTAIDAEDGNISLTDANVTTNINTQEAGTYQVTYKVTDSMGASATKTITVTVVDKNSVELILDGSTISYGSAISQGDKIILYINAPLDLLEKVILDGKELAEGNDYVAQEGSTIITLSDEVSKNLAVGEHKILTAFAGNREFKAGSLEISFNVAKAQAPNNSGRQSNQSREENSTAHSSNAGKVNNGDAGVVVKGKTPLTASRSNFYIFLGIAIVSGVGTLMFKRKANEE